MKLWERVRRWSKAVEECEEVDEEEEKEVKQAEELEEGEQGAEREVKENKRGDEEEGNDAKEAKQQIGQYHLEEQAEHSADEDVDNNDEDVVKIYCKANYVTVVFNTLTEFRNSSLLTDLTLSTEDGNSFFVHSLVLAAVSSLIRGSLKVDNVGLELLIDCSYSGAISLSWKCIFEITSTALQLQYQPALSLCLNFLHQEINPHSCLDVASFAEAYETVQLLEAADDFVLRQFQKVARTSKFKDLPAKKLLKYLKSHLLCVPSELVVFKAVVAWIQAKPKTRLKLTKDLMKTIHFPLMTFEEFQEVQSLNMWSDYSLAKLYEAIFEEFCSNETDYSQCRIYLPKESLILIGGDQTSEDKGSRSISRELWFGNSLRNHLGIKKAMEWRKLGEMPDPARYSHEVSVLRGQLYVFGGKNYYGTNDILNSVYRHVSMRLYFNCLILPHFRYDPLQNSWESLAEMQEKRCSFSVVVLDEKIYAIGGYCEPHYLESVERYCPVANSWSFTSPLDMPLSAHVAKVFQGQIFVSGGLSNQYQCLASMLLYHPETGSTYLENMAKPRAYHCMETLGNCLYVAGGIATDTVDQLACEVYNPEADSWTAFTSLPVPHVGAGSAVLEEKFYVLGGYSREDFSDTKIVHRYDPTSQRWEICPLQLSVSSARPQSH
uniref:Kelch-like family member 33 n=1 Tax=Dicentrarchus labrax TaxID=13489 RepID=A0A8P4G1V4_DICLA